MLTIYVQVQTDKSSVGKILRIILDNLFCFLSVDKSESIAVP